MGNRSLLPLFDEEELKFCFITNQKGDILYSEYFDPKLKEFENVHEKNFKSLFISFFQKKIAVRQSQICLIFSSD
jgi:hypothetical protein